MHKNILLFAAALAEGFAAFKALPAAQYLLGHEEGMAFTALVSLAFFYCWYVVLQKPANNKNKNLKAKVISFVTILFLLAPLSVGSIYVSSKLPEIENSKARIEAEQKSIQAEYDEAVIEYKKEKAIAEEQYRLNESARRLSLSGIRSEIKHTKKASQPEIFSQLLQAQKEASKPTEKVVIKKPKKREATEKAFKFEVFDIVNLQSILLALFTPLFIFLSTNVLVGPRPTKPRSSFNWSFNKAGRSTTGRADRNEREGHEETEEKNNDESFEDNQFLLRNVPTNEAGLVTENLVKTHLGISNRKAREARNQAVKDGYLVKKNSQYRYPEIPTNEGSNKSVNQKVTPIFKANTNK